MQTHVPCPLVSALCPVGRSTKKEQKGSAWKMNGNWKHTKTLPIFMFVYAQKTRRIFEYFLLVYSFKIVKNGSTKKFVTFDFIYLFLPTFVPVWLRVMHTTSSDWVSVLTTHSAILAIYALKCANRQCEPVASPSLPSHSPSHFNWRQHLGLRKWLEIAKRLHFG